MNELTHEERFNRLEGKVNDLILSMNSVRDLYMSYLKGQIERDQESFDKSQKTQESIAESLKVIAERLKGDVDPDLEYVRKTIDKL